MKNTHREVLCNQDTLTHTHTHVQIQNFAELYSMGWLLYNVFLMINQAIHSLTACSVGVCVCVCGDVCTLTKSK